MHGHEGYLHQVRKVIASLKGHVALYRACKDKIYKSVILYLENSLGIAEYSRLDINMLSVFIAQIVPMEYKL
jgi:hypothetical protein